MAYVRRANECPRWPLRATRTTMGDTERALYASPPPLCRPASLLARRYLFPKRLRAPAVDAVVRARQGQLRGGACAPRCARQLARWLTAASGTRRDAALTERLSSTARSSRLSLSFGRAALRRAASGRVALSAPKAN